MIMQNKLFYTWLRVAELRNIQAAKRIVAQRRRQKLKLARLLRPQLPLLASWEPLAKPHADATDDLGRVLSAACTSLPLAAGAQVPAPISMSIVTRPLTSARTYLQVDLQSLHETVFSCVDTVEKIEAMTDTFYATVRPLRASHCHQSAEIHSIPHVLPCRPARRAARWASSRGRSSRRWSAWRKPRGCPPSSQACRWVPRRFYAPARWRCAITP